MVEIRVFFCSDAKLRTCPSKWKRPNLILFGLNRQLKPVLMSFFLAEPVYNFRYNRNLGSITDLIRKYLV